MTNTTKLANFAIFTDLHGCYHTFLRLLKRCPKDHKIIFLGDLIDRGPNSRKMVEYAMDNEVPTCRANHDDLCLAYYNHHPKCANMYERGIWLYNGGDKALKNWPRGKVPLKVLKWFASLPPYIRPATLLDENGRELLCSHTGYGLSADDGNWFRALWGRHGYGDGPFPEDNFFRAFGHTHVEKACVTEKWANLDTGAAYGGGLTAFLWPSKETLFQSFDETPL